MKHLVDPEEQTYQKRHSGHKIEQKSKVYKVETFSVKLMLKSNQNILHKSTMFQHTYITAT